MLKIHFGPSWCTFVEGLTPEIEQKVYTLLSYHPEGYYFSLAYQMKRWDGYIHLYYTFSKSFRTGLLSRVLHFLEYEEGVPFEIVDPPQAAEFVQHSTNYTLRDYQLAAVQDIARIRYGIIQAPVRSGKTMMFIATVDSERKFPVVFFCRSLDLAYQTQQRVRQFLPEVAVGMVGDGAVDIRDITIVTVQSAYFAYAEKCKEKKLKKEKDLSSQNKMKVKNLIRTAKIVFYDEVHHMRGVTSQFLSDKCVSATMKIGLSATPFSGKEEDILTEQGMGPVIHKITFSALIRAGYVLKPYIYMYRVPAVGADGSNYISIYKQAVAENEFLTALVKTLVAVLVKQGKSVVVQTEFINHTKDLAEELGVPYLVGNDTTERRQEIIDKLRSKELPCIVSTLFEEGLDVASLDYTINLVGGLSSIATFQRMRSMTAVEGKDSCGIIDFYFYDKYLINHSKARQDLYESEPEFELEIRDVRGLTIEEIQSSA